MPAVAQRLRILDLLPPALFPLFLANEHCRYVISDLSNVVIALQRVRVYDSGREVETDTTRSLSRHALKR